MGKAAGGVEGGRCPRVGSGAWGGGRDFGFYSESDDEKPLNIVTRERHDPIFIAKTSLWPLRGRREASQVPEGVQSRE